jgi:hypothetical protein
VSISEFTKVGGLQAVEERLVAVQDYQAKLEEIDRLAETYRVSPAVTADVCHYLTACSSTPCTMAICMTGALTCKPCQYPY